MARNRREQRAALGGLRKRRLAEPGRRGFVRTYRARRIGTHRKDRPRPPRQRHRLRRGAGTALAGRRGSGPLQDHRRGRHLGAGPPHLGGHRDQRRGPRPAEPGHRVRLVVAAAPPHRSAGGRRSRRRDPQIGRRRRDLAEALPRPPLGGPPRHRPHRARPRAPEPGHRLCADRGLGRRERFLSLNRPRRELGKTQRLHLCGPAVLHGDLSGPAPAGPDLLHGRVGADHRRRREDLARPQQPLEARGQPRPGVRSQTTRTT